jgi:hypothetical protein
VDKVNECFVFSILQNTHNKKIDLQAKVNKNLIGVGQKKLFFLCERS